MGALHHDDTKVALRRAMITRRARLTPGEVGIRSAEICARVVGLPQFGAAERVVSYAVIGREVDPASVEVEAAARGKRVYRPVREERAFVADGATSDELLPAGAGRGVLFLVPGVAFDVRGTRLGRGAGWYDRALAPFEAAWRVGLAFDFQVVAALPAAPWDVGMHAIVTERRVLATGNGEPGHLRGTQT